MKKIFCLLLCLFLGFSLVSCSEEKELEEAEKLEIENLEMLQEVLDFLNADELPDNFQIKMRIPYGFFSVYIYLAIDGDKVYINMFDMEKYYYEVTEETITEYVYVNNVWYYQIYVNEDGETVLDSLEDSDDFQASKDELKVEDFSGSNGVYTYTDSDDCTFTITLGETIGDCSVVMKMPIENEDGTTTTYTFTLTTNITITLPVDAICSDELSEEEYEEIFGSNNNFDFTM